MEGQIQVVFHANLGEFKHALKYVLQFCFVLGTYFILLETINKASRHNEYMSVLQLFGRILPALNLCTM